MKKYLLFMLICVAFSGDMLAKEIGRFMMIQAVNLVKKDFQDVDVDYYFVQKDYGETDFLEVFVDAEPKKGWEHECYVYYLPQKINTSTQLRLKKKQLTMPPQGVTLIPVGNKNRYGDNANALPRLVPMQNGSVSNPMAERTYALIISGGVSKNNNYDRYWNDCSFIYQTLIKKYGIPKSNIYPIMSDGDNPAADMLSLSTYEFMSQPLDLDFDGNQDIHYSATKSNISSVLNYLSNRLQKDDHLFIYVIDHGGTNDNNMSSYIWLWNYETLQDTQLAQMLQPFTQKYVNVNVVLGQCFAGGFIDDLEKIGCVVTAASKGNESSYSCENLPYDEFVYHWTCAINGATHDNKSVDANLDGDKYITMEEAFNYANIKDTQTETPQFASKPASIGEDLAFNRFVPSIDLYIKDNWEDTGKVPNMTTEKFWISPSIWCRNQDDSIPQHQNPEFTPNHQIAFIYVKVYNRGKEKSTGKNWMHIYWAEASAGIRPQTWKGRELYNGTEVTGGMIEPINIPPIEPGDSATIRIRWSLPAMLENHPDENLHFCLLGRILDTPYDDGYVDGKPYFYVKESNDQAQKNVTIITKSNLLKPYNVFVRNIYNRSQNYSLELRPRTYSDGKIFSVADVEMEMTPRIYNAWSRGGKQAQGVTYQTLPNGTKKLKFVSRVNKISNVSMNGIEFDKVSLKFIFTTTQTFNRETYTLDLIQRDENDSIIGGETFIIQSPLTQAGKLPIEKAPTPEGEIRLSVDDDAYSSFLWRDEDGNDIGYTQNITVIPSANNDLISVTAITPEGELANGSISLASEFGIESIKKLSDSFIEVNFQNEIFDNGYLTITSLSDGLVKDNIELQSGIKSAKVDISSLSSGLYVVNYFVNGEVVDTAKFNK